MTVFYLNGAKDTSLSGLFLLVKLHLKLREDKYKGDSKREY